MKIGAAILFIIFLTIVGVGVFAMGEMNGHESCLATAINGFSCPTQSIVGEAFFHLNAARALTALLLIAPFLLLIFMVAFRGSTSHGGRTSKSLAVSYRLTAPRFDAKEWQNTSDAEYEGFNLDKLIK